MITFDGDFKTYVSDIIAQAGPWFDAFFPGVWEGYDGSASPKSVELVVEGPDIGRLLRRTSGRHGARRRQDEAAVEGVRRDARHGELDDRAARAWRHSGTVLRNRPMPYSAPIWCSASMMRSQPAR